MPSPFRLRTIFAPLVKLIARACIRIKITANMATGLVLISALIGSLLLILDHSLMWFGIFLFLTGIFDGVDGAIARLTLTQSKFGGVLDSCMDRLSEIIIFSALVWTQNQYLIFPGWLSLLLLTTSYIGSALISYTRARFDVEFINQESIKEDSNIGLMGRSERLFYLFILCILSQFLGNLLFSVGILIFTILIVLMVVFRIKLYHYYLK